MRRCAYAAVAAVLGASGGVLAQVPRPAADAAPPRVVLGTDVFDVTSGKVVAKLGGNGFWAAVTDGTGQQYDLPATKVDVATMQVLEISADKVTLRTVDHRVVWSVLRTGIGVAAEAKIATAYLTVDRVILPHVGGGLLALDRATGDVCWHRDDCPTRLVQVDGDLVIAAGEQGDAAAVLLLVSLHNGAVAFRSELGELPVQLAAGPHGIALLGKQTWSVHDRAGPRLFVIDGAPQQVVGGSDGWYALVSGEVRQWDRTGKLVWSQPMPPGDGESVCLRVSSEGRLLLWRFGDIWDSGFLVACLRSGDGELLWQHQEPGLGVPHSKYWHRVQLHDVGGRLVVTSQAAGGNFVVELDRALGTARSRVVLR